MPPRRYEQGYFLTYHESAYAAVGLLSAAVSACFTNAYFSILYALPGLAVVVTIIRSRTAVDDGCRYFA